MFLISKPFGIFHFLFSKRTKFTFFESNVECHSIIKNQIMRIFLFLEHWKGLVSTCIICMLWRRCSEAQRNFDLWVILLHFLDSFSKFVRKKNNTVMKYAGFFCSRWKWVEFYNWIVQIRKYWIAIILKNDRPWISVWKGQVSSSYIHKISYFQKSWLMTHYI